MTDPLSQGVVFVSASTIYLIAIAAFRNAEQAKKFLQLILFPKGINHYGFPPVI